MKNTQRIEDGYTINEFYGETHNEYLEQLILTVLGDLHFKYDTDKCLEEVVKEIRQAIIDDLGKDDLIDYIYQYVIKNYNFNITIK